MTIAIVALLSAAGASAATWWWLTRTAGPAALSPGHDPPPTAPPLAPPADEPPDTTADVESSETPGTGISSVVGAGQDPAQQGPAWSAVVDKLGLGVVVMTSGGEIRYRNPQADSMAGTHTGLLIDSAVKEALLRALDGEDTRNTFEFYGPPQVAVVIAAEPLPEGAAVATIEDVSDRRRVDTMRTDFVANISHELKTPVGALAVLAEALVDESDRAVIRRIADTIVGESHRVARTIDDLMELSKIELGEDQVREPVSVDDVVAAAVDRANGFAGAKGIRIAVLDVPDGVRMVGDRRQLVSALGNLVENAVKYSEAGATVQIRAIVEGGSAELMVADQGIGIPPAEQDRIFERFYRVDKGRGRDTGGTGLGLSIVRHVAHNHGGEVLVSSQEGEGSTFVLRIPVGSPNTPSSVPSEAPSLRRSTER